MYLSPDSHCAILRFIEELEGAGNFAECCDRSPDLLGHTATKKRKSARYFYSRYRKAFCDNKELFYSYFTKFGLEPNPISQQISRKKTPKVSAPKRRKPKHRIELDSGFFDVNSLAGRETTDHKKRSINLENSSDISTVLEDPPIESPASATLLLNPHAPVTPLEFQLDSSVTGSTGSMTPHFVLNLRNPEEGHNGWMAFRAPNVEIKNSLVDMVVLVKFFYDFQDLKFGGLKITLSDQGNAINVEEQSVPTFFGSHWENVLEPFRTYYKGALKGLYKSLRYEFEATLQAINDDSDRHTKRYTLMLPDGIQVTGGDWPRRRDNTFVGKSSVVKRVIKASDFSKEQLETNNVVSLYGFEIVGTRRALRRQDVVFADDIDEFSQFFYEKGRLDGDDGDDDH